MWTGGAILTAVARAKPYECVQTKDLVKLTGLDRPVVLRECGKLVGAGFMRRDDEGCHRITAAGRAAAAQEEKAAQLKTRSELYARVWYALRNAPTHTLTIPQIIAWTADGGERHLDVRIRAYLIALARAGYLMQMPRREPGMTSGSSGLVRWRLLKDTGPEAPVWRKRSPASPTIGEIYDPNTLEFTKLGKTFIRAQARRQRGAQA